MKKITGFLSLAVLLAAISCTDKKQKEQSIEVKNPKVIEVTVPAPPPPPPKTITIKLPPLPPPPPLPPKPKRKG